jgi:hypothetical protein
MVRMLLAMASSVICGAVLAAPFGGAPADIIYFDDFEDYQAIQTTTVALAVGEVGSGTVGVRLASQPPGAVAVLVASSDTGAATVSPSILNYTSIDHATLQTLTVSGVDDADTGNESVAVTLSSAGLLDQIVAVTVLDDDAATLSVIGTGSGSGSVTSLDGAINCPPTCSSLYATGTMVTLTAIAATTPLANDSVFTGWGGACSGTGTCVVTMSGPQQVSANFELKPNIAFVTSTTQNGNLGGLAGADAICQSLATTSSIAGTFRAYLSNTTVDAISRLGTASGWVRVDGKPVASTSGDFALGRLYYPMRITNVGVDVGDTRATTATRDGILLGESCSDYMSTSGNVTIGLTATQGQMFSANSTITCATASRLYCLGIDRAAVVQVIAPPARRIAFVTTSTWTPGGGIPSADTLCQTEAAGAGLMGSYRALLATSGASAASRFNTSGSPWGRVDGAMLTATASATFSATFWDTSPAVTADGSQYLGNVAVWGGALSLAAAGTMATTCNNWTSSAGMAGIGGRSGYSWVQGFFALDIANSCNATFIRLACFQQ